MNENEALIRTYLDALGRGDHALAYEAFAEEAAMSLFERFPSATRVRVEIPLS